MSTITRRTFVGGLGTALAAAALTGCGTHDADTSEPAGGTATSPTKLTFCLDYTPNTNHTGIYVALDKGYFAEEGLEVSIVQPAEDSAEVMVGTGRAQLGVSYQDYMANAFAGGNTGLEAVAAIIQHNTSGIMSKGGLGVTHPAAMEGKRYATWELAVEQATVRQVVETDGGDFDKVKMVPYTVEDDVAGIRADLYDCVWVFEGWAVQNAKVQGVDVDFFSFRSVDDVFDFYTPVIAANTTFAAENPDVVRAFLRAVKRGYEFVADNHQEAAQILLAAVPELDADLVEESLAFLAGQFQDDAAFWGEIDGARWSRFFQWLNDNDLVGTSLDVDAGWTMDYLAE